MAVAIGRRLVGQRRRDEMTVGRWLGWDFDGGNSGWGSAAGSSQWPLVRRWRCVGWAVARWWRGGGWVVAGLRLRCDWVVIGLWLGCSWMFWVAGWLDDCIVAWLTPCCGVVVVRWLLWLFGATVVLVGRVGGGAWTLVGLEVQNHGPGGLLLSGGWAVKAVVRQQ